MNRIDKKFEELRGSGQSGFIAYITAGDPTLEATKSLIVEMERRGVDLIELGIPFSDPLADGVVIQEASQRALKHHVSLRSTLAAVSEIRGQTDIPILLFTYYNPVHRYGLERFVGDAAAAGADGAVILDFPPEESEEYKSLMDSKGLKTVYLLAPTSTDTRVQLVSRYSSGFIYYVSREGVTGMRDSMEQSVAPMVQRIRQYSDKPVAVGFGVSSSEMAADVAQYADAVVVGSAIVKVIAENLESPDMTEKVGDFVQVLVEGTKGRHA